MKHVIIGGVAGGASVAARLRRVDEKAEIILFERGAYISYANCGLPYYIGDTIKERDRLFLQTPESFGGRFNLTVKVNHEVISIDPDQKSVKVLNRSSGLEYEESYDRLVLSPGAEPVRPPIPGIDLPGIFSLRNVADTDAIKLFLKGKQGKKAVVIGAGFIGLEMAENLHHLGMGVSIIEMADQVMAPLDFEMAAPVHRHLSDHGVELLLKEEVVRFDKAGSGIQVFLKSGKILEAELVILSIGVRAETRLAKAAGLSIGEAGGIWVNEYLQTSHPDIYAVGDAIEFPHPVSGKSRLVYLAGPANKQARICADNMAGGPSVQYKGAIGTGIAKVFDMTVASTGLPAKGLARDKIPYLESITHSGSHAGYYPGSLPMSIKICFSPGEGTLLGAQIVGYSGVDKRIDMVASLIGMGGTIFDLMELEHAYAPPFSSAKDPVNMAGFVAENILTGKTKPVYWSEISRFQADKQVQIIDVRTEEEHASGSVPGSLNIPLDQLRQRMEELSRERKVIIYCAVGLRGYLAERILRQHGFEEVYNLSGGYKTWQMAVTDQCSRQTRVREETAETFGKMIKIDACGLQCPGPVMKMKQAVDALEIGDRVEISATDAGFANDAEAWARSTGNKLISLENRAGIVTAVLEKGKSSCASVTGHGGQNKTLIVFSNDLDKAIASFILANGAAATGRKVSMFFTFWGLSVLKRKPLVPVHKTLIEKMFSMMLPSSSKQLGLSKMNMMGIGGPMIRWIMRSKRVDSLENLILQARENGVEFIACQMSMDVMGIKAEELIDGVHLGGVASYMERAEASNVNLFI